MIHTFTLNGNDIKVQFQEHSIHITNDHNLWELVGAAPVVQTTTLVQLIFQHYEQLYGTAFKVHPDSLLVEIWGHVYCEYFALVIENLVKMKLMEQITHKLISYCETIDCGETGYDDNRSLWDMLAPFHGLIAGCLPEDINSKDLKHD